MKIRVAHLLLWLMLTGLAAVISGCASAEPDNASMRPWNSPEGWQSGQLGGMNNQHR
jgi:hypothetical protein